MIFIDGRSTQYQPLSEEGRLTDEFLRALPINGNGLPEVQVLIGTTLSPLNPIRKLLNSIAPLPAISLADYVAGKGGRIRRVWLRPVITTVPLGIAVNFGDDGEALLPVFLAQHGLNQGYLLYVGGSEPVENLEGLLYAYHGLPLSTRPKLVVAQQELQGFARLKDLTQQLEISPDVIWLESIMPSERSALLCGARLLLYPSLGPGTGLPIVQAMACGVPVLASELDLWKTVGAGAVSYVDFSKPEQAAARIEQLLGDDNRLAYFRQIGRERAKRFLWPAVVKVWLAQYH